MKKMTLFLFFCFPVLTCAGIIPNNVKIEAQQRVKHGYNPSIALAVYSGGETETLLEGWANLKSKTPITEDSVFEIGSITKTMTALLLADAVIHQNATLEQTINELLPEEQSLQSAPLITLKQLATHSSGLPRLPSGGINPFSKDPYADYSREDLLTAIANQAINSDNQQYAYSNYGAGLLGELLAMSYRKDYQTLLSEKVLQPLGLENTYADASLVPEHRRVTGYAGQYQVPNWHFKALAGAGSVNSSIKDLIAYGLAILNADHPELKAAIELSTTAHYHHNGVAMGLGWHINEGVLWHNGGTAGFRSILMIDPSQNKVVAGITNQAEHDVEDIVVHLVWPEKEMRRHDFPVEISESELEKYQGFFHNKQVDKTIQTSIKDGHLMLHFPKQPAYQLTHLGNHRFVMKLTKTRVRFETNDSNHVNRLYFKAWGDEMVYERE